MTRSTVLLRISSTSRVPFVNEALALVAVLVVALSLPQGAHGAVIVAAVVGAAPLILHGLGILLVHRANRFINFSQIAVGAFAAVLFDGLARGRVLLRGIHTVCGVCVSDTPGSTAIAVNFWVSALIAVVAAGVIAAVAYLVVVQRFSRSPVLVLTIVTIFLGQALAGSQKSLTNKLVREDLVTQHVLPRRLTAPVQTTWRLAGFPIHFNEVLLVIAAGAALAGVAGYLRWSATGSVVRAAADNPGRARTLGVDVGSVTARVWLLSGLLGGLAGVLGAFTGAASLPDSTGTAIDLSQLTLVLAAVVVARFSSTPMLGAGALVLSLLSASVQLSYGSQAPLEAAYIFIVGGLLLIQRDRRGRADREDFSGLDVAREVRPVPRQLRDLPVVRSYLRGLAGFGAVVLLGLPYAVSAAQTSLLTDTFLLAVVGLSLLVLTGWAGQVSLGQFGFAAIGAWTAAVSHLPFPFAILLAGLAGSATAVVVGLPALKLRGLNLAISTLAFSVSAHALFVDDRYLGSYLPSSLTAPRVLGIDFTDERVAYYAAAVVVLLACAVVGVLRRSRTGRVLIALRANEAAAQSFGINVLRARLVAFSVSGSMAAVAGALIAYHLGQVAPASFSAERSFTVFLYTVIGGLGGLAGPLLGLLYYGVITFFFSTNPLVQYTASGTGALLLLLVAPGGLGQLVYAGRDAMLRRVAFRLRIAVPSLMGDKGSALSMDRMPLDEERRAARRDGDPVPVMYEPTGQWALDRFGRADVKERVGA